MDDLGNPKQQHRTVAVVGLGYVGLPLALLMAEKGYHVIGIDLDSNKIQALHQGVSYITEITDDEIKAALDSGRFHPHMTFGQLQVAESVIICVPTPLHQDGTPDLSFLIQASTDVGSRIRKGQLVVMESSTYPGTTREVVLPILEQSGLKVGKDIYLGYSPERVDPGNADFPVGKIPKIVSGITADCLARMAELYGNVFPKVHPVSSTEAGEMAKLLENSYRLVNISFINELAMICDALGLNLWEVIDAASTKPFGFNRFNPGPGIGGHCIPVDPSYLLWKLNQIGLDSAFIQISNSINHRMPQYIVEKVKTELLPKNLGQAKILVYGAAYKKDIADYRESASLEIIALLRQAGADVFYHDPYIPNLRVEGVELVSTELSPAVLSRMDAVILATDHSAMPVELLLEHATLLYDTRNAIGGRSGKAKVVLLGGG